MKEKIISVYLVVVVASLLSNPSNAFTLNTMSNKLSRNSMMVSCKMSNGNNNSDFWEAQKNLAKSMTDTMDIQEGRTPEL